MSKLDIITLVIIMANVIVSFKGFGDFSFFNKYKFNVGAVRRGEQIRILTSGFLHVHEIHLFFNMFTLYFFADGVIRSLGSLNFLLIYFGSLILGNLQSLYFHRDEYHFSAVGASGAVTGVLYAAILLEPGMKLFLMFIPIAIPAYIFGIGYLLYSIYGMKNRVGNIDHNAHFGGAVGGYALSLILAPEIVSESPLMVILLFIPILILYILMKMGKI